jgi:transcriptional regulator with XRE-family HTH domain
MERMGATFDAVIAHNVLVRRAMLKLSQAAVARRMTALGYTIWKQQTVVAVEHSRRRLAAVELLGLALALETTIAALLTPSEEDSPTELPSGAAVSGPQMTGLVHGLASRAVTWQDDQPEFGATAMEYDAFVRILAELLRMPGGSGSYEVYRQPDGSIAIVIRQDREPFGRPAAVTLDRG